MIPIPDHPVGERFCRKCGVFLPLKDFFKGKKRRYECKVHSRGRPRKAPSKKQKERERAEFVNSSQGNPQKKNAIAQVWHAAYTDCRCSFGQATVGMSQAELRDLFKASGRAEPSTAFRLVPIDPCRALERENARLVRREVRIRALRAWWDAKKRAGKEEEGLVGRDTYMAVLQQDAAAGGGVSAVEGLVGPGGLVTEEQREEEVGVDEQEWVGEGEGADDVEGEEDDNTTLKSE